MTSFQFQQQLTRSNQHVARVVRWLQANPNVFVAQDVQDDPAYYHTGDILFVPKSAVQHIEVKVESRSSGTTPNLAIERYSNVASNRPGGPWSTKAEWYSHFYADGLLVMVKRLELVRWLTPALVSFPTFEARNEHYTSMGYLIPRVTVRAAVGKFYREYHVPPE